MGAPGTSVVIAPVLNGIECEIAKPEGGAILMNSVLLRTSAGVTASDNDSGEGRASTV